MIRCRMRRARFRRAAFILPAAVAATVAAFLTVPPTVGLLVVGLFYFAFMLSLLLAFLLLRSYKAAADRGMLIGGVLSVVLSIPCFVAFTAASNGYFPRPLDPAEARNVLIGAGLTGGAWALFAAFALEPLLVRRDGSAAGRGATPAR